jgi:hypothetical protein
MTIVNEQQRDQQSSPAFRTLEEKIDELANDIRGIRDIIWDRKKTIIRQMDEIRQLASCLNIDSIQLRKMILESFADIDVSESWLRKMLPETLKLTKHTRKDYLKRQLQRDQQPLHQQPEQRQRELVELPTSSSSRHPAVEQRQQPSDNEEKTGAATTKVTTYVDDDNHSIAVIPLLTQKENEGLVEKSSDDKNKIIEKLHEKIEELQQEITYLHEQQQKQQEEKFTAVGNLELQKNDIPVKVIVNVKTKSIEWMEIARELIQKSYEDDIL